uniref:Dickkopf WNT signaling pathway inhibitor 4 n=1 Tax=Pelodiscus sinensis TaxID=13735 RepID=K7FAY0_PELSI|nr:dickkopf-related protein 4 isoform X2 [Pelodiscus sinensis]XP_025035604.1 dickkopf-related protein 4 isoform X2 [Pelodiscus sinensis]XP_025035605.1 dickkopf-related protein 4 isoform X2 [Pelodiscus sinensis]|eukprot:XP_006113296.1 dickkopf-related protein 4 isoform X2 [Pelodiscus sinensis]
MFSNWQPGQHESLGAQLTVKTDHRTKGLWKRSQCLTDQDCNASKFCLKPEDKASFCATCRGLQTRCKRNAMCCPGTVCLNDVCGQTEEVIPTEGRRTDRQDGSDAKGSTQHQIQENSKKGLVKSQSSKGQEGESCLRTSDCAFGFCCARHFWTKICKPVLSEGLVCSRRGNKDVAQGPAIFQRCDCGPGLSCQSLVTGMPQQSRLNICQRS